jgi:hypothetical protein
MARLFNDAASEILSVDQAAITAAPFTFCAWGYSDDATAAQCVISVGDKDTTNTRWALKFSGNAANDPVRFDVRGGGSQTEFATTTGYSVNTWHHVAAVEASATDHRVFIDGGSKGTSTTSVSPAGADRTSIGRLADGTGGQFFSGRIAHVAIWNVALTDDEILALARRLHPVRIRPGSLVGYWPVGVGSPDPNWAAGTTALNMTVTGTTIADNPPIMSWFGLGHGWRGAFAAPAPAGVSAGLRTLALTGAGI